MRKGSQLFAAFAALALVAAACGNSEETGGGGDKTVTVELNEWAVTPDASSVTAGMVTFAAKNTGKIEHELVVLKTDLAPDKLPAEGAKVEEDAAGITEVGEIEEFDAGKTESKAFDLSPGKYVLICNIAGHYAQGMRTPFEVK